MLNRRQRRRLWLLVAVFLAGGFLYWRQEIQFLNNRTPEDWGTVKRKIIMAVSNFTTKQNVTPAKPSRFPKVYIYDLPSEFNIDIAKCVSPPFQGCFQTMNGGFGRLLYKVGELNVYNTNQFSLEVVLHHLLLSSEYRTINPEEADLFYIPAYMGTKIFCQAGKTIAGFVEDAFSAVRTLPYFDEGKPHFSSLAKIEREQAYVDAPVLFNPSCRNVTFLLIEKDASEGYRQSRGLANQDVVVVPYPSYVHLDNSEALSQTISSPGLKSRKIFMFLAAGDRRSNYFRNSIVDQFPHKLTDTKFKDFMTHMTTSGQGVPQQVWLNTQECSPGHMNITIDWMQNSVFCLQPHGDSPTRKSFYDGIEGGCIPVIFKFDDEKVEYPFQRVLNYSDFVVTINATRIVKNNELVLNILKQIPEPEIQRLHNNVLRVARQLQYSAVRKPMPVDGVPYEDALDMIMNELKYKFNLRNCKKGRHC